MNSFLSHKFDILSQAYVKSLRILVYALVFVSGLGIFSMILVTCGDVILRRVGHAFVGAYDIVKIAGAITLASALPYTTAVKGHVAIEYFFQKLPTGLRRVVEAIIRVLVIILFGFLGWRSCIYGHDLSLWLLGCNSNLHSSVHVLFRTRKLETYCTLYCVCLDWCLSRLSRSNEGVSLRWSYWAFLVIKVRSRHHF